MAETRKKTSVVRKQPTGLPDKSSIKRPPSRKKAAGKRASPRKPRRGKKPTRRDFGQAMLLTAILIAVSAVVSMAALSIRQKDRIIITQEIETPETAPEIIPLPEMPAPRLAVQDSPVKEAAPARKNTAVSKPPQEKSPAADPAKPQTANKAPVNKPVPEQTPAKVSAPAPRNENPTPVMQTASLRITTPPELPPQQQGTLVFIIDDAGNNLQELEPFLRFPGPLTIAVLPGLPHSAEAARRIRSAGKEVFLHQPMEALGGQNPGPGAIYADMDAAEVLAVLRRNIAEVGPIAGMNNHQGSKITMNQQMMETVLAFCREQGIYFLDSRTTAETAVPAAAKSLGIKIGERNIFIDNEQSRSSMNQFIESGLSRASQNGNAVMIGHTWSPELAPLLADRYQDLIARGYNFARASELIKY